MPGGKKRREGSRRDNSDSVAGSPNMGLAGVPCIARPFSLTFFRPGLSPSEPLPTSFPSDTQTDAGQGHFFARPSLLDGRASFCAGGTRHVHSRRDADSQPGLLGHLDSEHPALGMGNLVAALMATLQDVLWTILWFVLFILMIVFWPA